MMADQPTSPPGKKLYIETVGCQMNLLDSELVVAKLRFASTRKTRSTVPWGGSSVSRRRGLG
jgi:Uncharacterized protein family UPF0004